MYCKAGYKHADLADCEHVVSQTVTKRFELPDDFYSPEATRARKEANKVKYQPGLRRRQLVIRAEVNEAREVR